MGGGARMGECETDETCARARACVFRQAVEKKTNGVRAALRVENKVAVRAMDGRIRWWRCGWRNPICSGLGASEAPDAGRGREGMRREGMRREGSIVKREMRTWRARGEWVDEEDAQRLTEDDVDSFARVDSLHAQGSQKGTLLPYHRH